MKPTDNIVVIDKDGNEAYLEEGWEKQDGKEVRLRLPTGQILLLPKSSLFQESSTRYRFNRRFKTLVDEFSKKSTSLKAGDRFVIPVVEEVVDVKKERVESGRVQISKSVHEQEKVIEETTRDEQVRINYVPVNQVVEEEVPARTEGNTVIVPLYEEVLVVTKKLLLREELHITKEDVVNQVSDRVKLRREEVTVKRTDSGQAET